MSNPTEEFLPALRYHVLTPLYDVGIRLTMPERHFKDSLINAAKITAGHRVLDVGCGTGTLLQMIAVRVPEAILSGIDPDERILMRARRKLAADVTLDRGSATALPYHDENFDRVLSSLVIHHLPGPAKATAFREIHRVLRTDGEFHLADFGAPDSATMLVASFLTEKIGREAVTENFRGLLPAMLEAAGFHDVTETARFRTIFGVLRLLRGVR